MTLRGTVNPSLYFEVFEGPTGDRRVYPLQPSDYQPETPDQSTWVSGFFGLNPEKSTRAWVGRSDRIARCWPVLMEEASGGSCQLLSENALSEFLYDTALTALVQRFLRVNALTPVMVFAHNMVWREESYAQFHQPKLVTASYALKPRFITCMEEVSLRPRPVTKFSLRFTPSLLPWETIPGHRIPEVGFKLDLARIRMRLSGRAPFDSLRYRLSVGNESSDFRHWHNAGIFPAMKGLTYQLTRCPALRVVPFEPGCSVPRTFGALDVQLIKIWWLWNLTVGPKDPFDVMYDELSLGFNRRTGGLIYLELACNSFLRLSPEDALIGDWGIWIGNHFGIGA